MGNENFRCLFDNIISLYKILAPLQNCDKEVDGWCEISRQFCKVHVFVFVGFADDRIFVTLRFKTRLLFVIAITKQYIFITIYIVAIC